ncbi:MAG: hypothetical protein WBN40_09145 [Pseudomonadales bacterium]
MFRNLIIVLAALMVGEAQAGIAVEPAYVNLDLNVGRASGQFIITNTGNKEERYRVNASHFTYDDSGTLQLADPNGEHSMAMWIKFNPKEFTLPPNSKRVVRYVVLPKTKVKNGQYWAAMELESLEGRDYTTDDGAGRTFNLKVVPAVLAPMFGKQGQVVYDFDVKAVELKKTARNKMALEVEIENLGNTVISFRGLYEIVNEAGEQLVESTMDGGMLLREKTRKFVTFIEPDIPPGKYKLNIFYGYRETDKTIERTLDLVIE